MNDDSGGDFDQADLDAARAQLDRMRISRPAGAGFFDQLREVRRRELDLKRHDEVIELLQRIADKSPPSDRKSSDAGSDDSIVGLSNSERDKWLYEQQLAGNKRALIRSRLRAEHSEWEPLETDQAVTAAVRRYCERYQLPRPGQQG